MTLACRLCGSTEYRLQWQVAAWRYRRCLNCGLVALFPQPDPDRLRKDYQGYLPTAPDAIARWQAMITPVNRAAAGLIESWWPGRRPGRLLDIGCGYGFFLARMQARGWQVTGVELSPTGARYARRRWGIAVHQEAVEDLALAPQGFDVITLFYLIEHVADPVALMAKVNRMLKPGGLVLLRWPHSTPIVRLLGPLARFFDLYHTPYHLYDFSPATMKLLLERCGFGQVCTTVGGHTCPARTLEKWVSLGTGRLAEYLQRLSAGRFLLPGVSKTTLAVKAHNR